MSDMVQFDLELVMVVVATPWVVMVSAMVQFDLELVMVLSW